MRLALLALSCLLTAQGAITVSNVWTDHVSHGVALVHFTVTGTTVGDATGNSTHVYWNFLKVCWGSPGACGRGTGTVMPTGYPNAQSASLREGSNYAVILTGLTPGMRTEACPNVSQDRKNWVSACGTFTTTGQPAIHPVPPDPPRVGPTPAPPTDYTGFHSGASTGATTAGAVTACANLQADIQSAIGNQTNYGTVISLAPGQEKKCAGRFYAGRNPPDVRVFGAGDVNTANATIHIPNHGLTEGSGVQFSDTYSDLPGEKNTAAHACMGIKPAQVYYAHSPDANFFQITCDYPYPRGRIMRFANQGGGGNLFMARYPRKLYPIVIRTATPDSQLPPPGTRINPSWSPKLAVLQPDTRCGGGICHYPPNGYGMRMFILNFGDTSDDGNKWLNANMWGVGLEIQSIDATGDTSFNPVPTWVLLSFKEGTSDNGLDRCYIHGQYPFPNRLAQGISWEGHNNAITNSYFDRITYPFHDNGDSSYQTEGTQFIIADRGPGPYFFVNNFFQSTGNGMHFQGSGENGFDVKLLEDIYLSRNTFTQNPPDSPQKYCSGNPGADGWNYRNRQPLEFKGGYRARIDGNIFEYDCHWLASSMIANTSVTAGIMDLSFTNNTIRHASSVGMMGSSTQGGYPIAQSPTNRYAYRNNLIYDVDGFKYIDHMSNAYPGGWRGWIIQTMQDGEDMVWSHNTVVTQKGSNAAMFWGASSGAEGFEVMNNFIEAHSDANATGLGARTEGGMNEDFATACNGFRAEALLTCEWRFPRGNVSGNVFSSDSLSAAEVRLAWPHQRVLSTPSDLSLVGWYEGYRLRNDSAYASTALDQFDFGADIDALERAQGKVLFTSVQPSSTSATIHFVAPDSQACPVDISATDASLINSFTRVGDQGSNPGPRTVTLSGLTPRTDYYLRVNCAVEQPRATFRTN
jgi:hypothetical protein